MSDPVSQAIGSINDITVDNIKSVAAARDACHVLALHFKEDFPSIATTFGQFKSKLNEILAPLSWNFINDAHTKIKAITELAPLGRQLRAGILECDITPANTNKAKELQKILVSLSDIVVNVCKHPSQYLAGTDLLLNFPYFQNFVTRMQDATPKTINAINAFTEWKANPLGGASVLISTLKSDLTIKGTDDTTSALTAYGTILMEAVKFIKKQTFADKEAMICELMNEIIKANGALKAMLQTMKSNDLLQESCNKYFTTFEAFKKDNTIERACAAEGTQQAPFPKTIPECVTECNAAGEKLKTFFPGIKPLLNNISKELEALNSLSIIPAFTTVSAAITELQLFIINTPVTNTNAPHIQNLIDFLNSIKPIAAALGDTSTEGKETSTTSSYFTAAPFVPNGSFRRFINVDDYIRLDCLKIKVPEIAQALQTNIDLINRYLCWKLDRHQNPTSTQTDIIDDISKQLTTITKGSESEHILLACYSYILCDMVNYLDPETTRKEAVKLVDSIDSRMKQIRTETGYLDGLFSFASTANNVKKDKIAALKRYEKNRDAKPLLNNPHNQQTIITTIPPSVIATVNTTDPAQTSSPYISTTTAAVTVATAAALLALATLSKTTPQFKAAAGIIGLASIGVAYGLDKTNAKTSQEAASNPVSQIEARPVHASVAPARALIILRDKMVSEITAILAVYRYDEVDGSEDTFKTDIRNIIFTLKNNNAPNAKDFESFLKGIKTEAAKVEKKHSGLATRLIVFIKECYNHFCECYYSFTPTLSAPTAAIRFTKAAATFDTEVDGLRPIPTHSR